MTKVLIIEDDIVNCIVYKAILIDDDTKLDFAYDGKDGINKYLQNSYDLLLLDMGLPDMEGHLIASVIREFESKDSKPALPIIVVSADNSIDKQAKAFEAGVDRYLTKPINKNQLRLLYSLYCVSKCLLR